MYLVLMQIPYDGYIIAMSSQFEASSDKQARQLAMAENPTAKIVHVEKLC